MTGISEKHPRHFQRFPTIFRRLPNFAGNVWRYSDDLWTLTIQTDYRHWKAFAIVIRSKEIIHKKSEMKWRFFRTTHPDLWVRREILSLMREIDVFSSQAWDSCIMRESWQVYIVCNKLFYLVIIFHIFSKGCCKIVIINNIIVIIIAIYNLLLLSSL